MVPAINATTVNPSQINRRTENAERHYGVHGDDLSTAIH
jgi:hypothetical protein